MNSYTPPVELQQSYAFEKLLGEGANGKTWLAASRVTGKKVAIKELKLERLDDLKSLELFKREAEVLQSINVEGVPKFYESIITNDSNYIIQEFIPYPSIQSAIDHGKKFTEKETLNILERLATILNDLETQYHPPVIHRDIKPSNLLYFDDEANRKSAEANMMKIYLIDFGAVANPCRRSGGSTIAGTFGYMAPEQMQGNVAIQSDFYAMGATALHMLTGLSPINITSDVFELNFEETIRVEAPDTSRQMIDLLKLLLDPAVDKRPATAEAILKAIANVKNKRNPLGYISTKSKLNNDFQRVDKDAFSVHNDVEGCPTTPTFLWRLTDGTAWKVTWLNNSPAFEDAEFVEYTYEYRGQMFVGFWPLNKVDHLKKFQDQHFPFPVKVFFNPSNPRISRLKEEL